TIDYVVTKVPRFTFEKFPQAEPRLTTQMKSVGEVMAMGRTFQESLQKALRGLETGSDGFNEKVTDFKAAGAMDLVRHELRIPGPDRLWYVADAFRAGLTLTEVESLCHIDPWFLCQIEDLVQEEGRVRAGGAKALDAARLRALKRRGFADSRLAKLVGMKEPEVRALRLKHGVRPVYKRVDSCAAEFASTTAYMYSTYEDECEAEPTSRDKIMVLGGGPNRIGQGIEFDYCCVHAALALKQDGYETIMVNCNPETVSTDYDTSDRLYFEPLTFEDVMEIIDKEKPKGVIVQFGGQTPLKLARALEAAGAPIIGTSPDSIDLAEDRERFSKLVDKLGLLQPPARSARTEAEAVRLSKEVGYPLMVRPSYVLGGRAMEVVFSEDDLVGYIRNAVKVSNDSPVLMDRFLDDATEVDVDALSDGEQVMIGGIMEHVEQAGVHSGDSSCSLPPNSLSQALQEQIRVQVVQLAKALKVVGLMNVQFAIQKDRVYILEVNPRASRTSPFVSKVVGVPLAKVAARCMAGKSLKAQGIKAIPVPRYFAVKAPVFPFIKFRGADPILGPEMKSTGEVMGAGFTFGEAYAKAQFAAGIIIPRGGKALLSVREQDKPAAVGLARELRERGFTLVATRGTAATLQAAGVPCEAVNKVREGRPHVVDMIKNDELSLIVNTTEGKQAILESFSIRREAVSHKVTYYTTIAAAKATVIALDHLDEAGVNKLQDLHREWVA
ncbi:MAG TPA: carbamoyl-phosphate synthase large subunit, partial [Gammaproteobacteria bacterium]|nr:carbamoyl-phosphate synthase large subunit [Gammaproteobacteria bacterium]